MIYIADDEKFIRELVAMILRKEGYQVQTFETGDQLLLASLEKMADLVILDVMMPGTNGFHIVERIRQKSQVPIILLTARDSEPDYIDGFEMGADDYFTKPFSPIKLVLKVKALLSRHLCQTKGDLLNYQGLNLLSDSPVLEIGDEKVRLTSTEYKVMQLLMKSVSRTVSREQLLDEVWGFDSDVETRVTDDTIKRIRKKLRQVNSHVIIETVWGQGFRLVKKKEVFEP
ncbi:response regulator transcription factor [Streptococcus pluranimalium]|uniref:response regulator transcription factor n=1 Tax=Streptococcus pluranimalium TaxID=82348 RepID=UPI0039FC2440